MKSAIFAAALAAIGASAAPLKRAAAGTPTTTQVLQYALTLENLENKFYMEALSNYTEADFEAAGYPAWVRGRYSQISTHESEHVALLSGALGNDTVAPCTYSFGVDTVQGFVGLATVIENVGVSAYAGAAQYITTAAYTTVAAVILSTEARHQAWQNAAVAGLNPWGSAYDTPLGLDMVYTIASAFIVSCPSSNPALPVMAFPALTVSAGAAPGASATFTFDDPHNATNYAIFYSGLGTAVVALDENDMATIPSTLQGISYVIISTVDAAANVTNANIVSGPALLDFPFGSNVANPAFGGVN